MQALALTLTPDRSLGKDYHGPVKALVVLLLLSLSYSVDAVPRTQYRSVWGTLADGRVAWRAWDQDGPRLLVVDPATLRSEVVSGTEGDLTHRPPADTAWDKLRAGAYQRREGLQNAGLRRGHPQRHGAWLTFDLCPSSLPLDRRVLEDLEGTAPLPVFLGVSGRWMETHPDDLDWLIAQRNAGRLEITWVNHTENHAYRPGVPLAENFLFLPGTDLKKEIFPVEQALLDRGEVPSVFFRFPGLVSSADLVEQVLALGLIPLGSSAWLAKQQAITPGALVLTHANGNEPIGLERLETWVKDHRTEVETGHWHWLGLQDWIGGEPQ